jgi:hypothetical protein
MPDDLTIKRATGGIRVTTKNYWQSVLTKRVGRRRAIAVTGATSAAAAFLAACGGGSDEPSGPSDRSGLVTEAVDTSKQAKAGGVLKHSRNADIANFDPATITDHSTYDAPQTYATGVRDVFVNGVQVLSQGEHTGAKPGRFVRGPGWKAPEGAKPAQ